MVEISGACADRFGAVREAFAEMLGAGELGASVAVHVDGVAEVDLWGGHLDQARSTPWQRDTIVNVFSITKPMTALCALILADRGELDLDAPVARYWPEFAAAGKGGVLVRHLLSHTAGLPTWADPMTVADLYDWDVATSRLAAQQPAWAPGTDAGYHAITQGFLVGEVVRRVTGRTLGAFFSEEVAGPLGADFHIGLAQRHDHRVAPVFPPPGDGSDGTDEQGNPHVDPREANTSAWRRAGLPAAGGHGNARSVGDVQSVLACGGEARGVRLLSPAGCERALAEQFRGKDRVLGIAMRWGLGYGLLGGQLPNPRTCCWGGWGGSMVVLDLDARMTVSFTMNQMFPRGQRGDARAFQLVLAAYECLGE